MSDHGGVPAGEHPAQVLSVRGAEPAGAGAVAAERALGRRGARHRHLPPPHPHLPPGDRDTQYITWAG